MEEKSFLYKKTFYQSRYEFLRNVIIQEWDLEKANISVLTDAGYFTDAQYQDLMKTPKKEREELIGRLQRDDRSVTPILQTGIEKARRDFFIANSICDENVLYIDNDSITVVRSPRTPELVTHTQFSARTRFRLKNTYTSFYHLYLMDFLYFNDGIHENFRCKYADNEKIVNKHSSGFLDLLLSISYAGQTNRVLDIVRMIQNAYRTYAMREFGIEYYREFNRESLFRVLNTDYSVYYSDSVPNSYKDFLDISFNANLLRYLYKIYIKEYFEAMYNE